MRPHAGSGGEHDRDTVRRGCWHTLCEPQLPVYVHLVVACLAQACLGDRLTPCRDPALALTVASVRRAPEENAPILSAGGLLKSWPEPVHTATTAGPRAAAGDMLCSSEERPASRQNARSLASTTVERPGVGMQARTDWRRQRGTLHGLARRVYSHLRSSKSEDL